MTMIKAYKLLTKDLKDTENDYQYKIGKLYNYSASSNKHFYASKTLDIFYFPEEYQYKIYEVELNGEYFSYQDDRNGIFSSSIKIVGEVDINTIIPELVTSLKKNENLTSECVTFLLKTHPLLVNNPQIPITGCNVVQVINNHPCMIDTITQENLEKINGRNLTSILTRHPFLIHKPIFSKLSQELNSYELHTIILTNPELINLFSRYHLGRYMNGGNISTLLCAHPTLSNTLDVSLIIGGCDIATLLGSQPQFIDDLSLDQLEVMDGTDISFILKHQPQLVGKLNTSLVTLDDDIYEILKQQPQLVSSFSMDKLPKPLTLSLLNFHKTLYENLRKDLRCLSKDDIMYLNERHGNNKEI